MTKTTRRCMSHYLPLNGGIGDGRWAVEIIPKCLDRLNARILDLAIANFSDSAFRYARATRDFRQIGMFYGPQTDEHAFEKFSFFHDGPLSAHLWVVVNPLMGVFCWHSPMYG